MKYRLVGAISFYERREVKDLLAYLRLLANPADDEAFLRSAGSWKGLVDTERLIRDIYENRLISTRPEPKL